MNATWKKHTLKFKQPSGTSRGVLTARDTYILIIEANGVKGYGECGMLKGLSFDDKPGYEEKLNWVCTNIEEGLEGLYPNLMDWPSIQFGLEQAFQQLERKGSFVLFNSPFAAGERGIPINGLIWMGDIDNMAKQVEDKLAAGFTVLKLKIGANNWDDELALIKGLRKRFDSLELEIRLDANGAFSFTQAEKVLDQLASQEIHSIEQPIKPGQIDEMSVLVEDSLVPIALDEELIGVHGRKARKALLEEISPEYIILKPSLIGGWRGAEEWIELAEDWGVDWWATSALESNIGLSAISQWVATKPLRMPQGLGTGGLYTSNFTSPLELSDAQIWYHTVTDWDLSALS